MWEKLLLTHRSCVTAHAVAADALSMVKHELEKRIGLGIVLMVHGVGHVTHHV